MEWILFPICYSEVVLGRDDFTASIDNIYISLTVNMSMFYHQSDLEEGREKL